MERIIQLLTSEKVIANLFYTTIVIVCGVLIKKIICKICCKKQACQNKQFTIKRIVNSISWALIIIAIIIIWNRKPEDIVSIIGIFSAGMAIAMKDIWLNIIAGIYITATAKFRIGDRIEVMEQIGDVIDIKLLGFNMLEVGNRVEGEQSTGRIVHIPNMCILTHAMANYEKGFKYIWNEVSVRLSLESDLERSRQILYEVVEEINSEVVEEARKQIDQVGKRYALYYNYLTPIVYVKVKEGVIELTVRYLCEPRKCRVSEDVIWTKIIEAMKQEEGIKIV